MKYIDFSVQAVILLLMVAGFVHDPKAWSMSILIAQMVLGPWQYISSLISVIAKAPFMKQKRRHLIISTIYLLMIYAATQKPYQGVIPSDWVFPAMTIPAWSLALYYFRITCRWTFSKTKSGGNFLPHLSF